MGGSVVADYNDNHATTSGSVGVVSSPTLKSMNNGTAASSTTKTTHTGAIMDVKMRGCRVITGSKDKTIKLWDVRQPSSPILTLYGHSHAVHSVDFSDDFIVSGSVDTGLRVW